MGSIQSHPGTKNWYAHYTLPNGKRKAVSTGTDNEFEARQVLNKLEQAADLASKQQLTRRRAFKLVNEIAEAVGMPVFEEESVGSFLERWLRGQTVKKGTLKSYQSLIRDFKSYLGKKIADPILFLSARDCNGFKQWLIDKGLSDATINQRISTMTTVFSDAEKQEQIDSNPFSAVARIKKVKTAQKRPFSRVQFGELLSKTDGEWQTLVLIAGLTGQRQKDCSTLKWEQVDFEKGVINFERRKNNDRFDVPMHPKLVEHLSELRSREGSKEADWIMPRMAKRPATGRESISDIFRNEILPRIGIVQKYQRKEGAGRAVSEYSFHCLRHSLSTWLNEIGVSEVDRMRIVGHDDPKVSRGYTHTEIKRVAKSLERLVF